MHIHFLTRGSRGWSMVITEDAVVKNKGHRGGLGWRGRGAVGQGVGYSNRTHIAPEIKMKSKILNLSFIKFCYK